MEIKYSKTNSRKDAFCEIRKVITPDYLSKFNVKADLDYNEAKNCIQAKGKGFTLDINFNDDCCSLDIDLSFMLKPFKNKILDTLSAELKKHL